LHPILEIIYVLNINVFSTSLYILSLDDLISHLMHRNRLDVKNAFDKKNQRKLFYTEAEQKKNERICKDQRTIYEVNMILRDKDVLESHSSLQ